MGPSSAIISLKNTNTIRLFEFFKNTVVYRPSLWKETTKDPPKQKINIIIYLGMHNIELQAYKNNRLTADFLSSPIKPKKNAKVQLVLLPYKSTGTAPNPPSWISAKSEYFYFWCLEQPPPKIGQFPSDFGR